MQPFSPAPLESSSCIEMRQVSWTERDIVPMANDIGTSSRISGPLGAFPVHFPTGRRFRRAFEKR